MTKYTVSPGKTNFRPLESWKPIWKPIGFEVDFTILPGGWCSEEDWEGDLDIEDWWKLKGLTHYLSVNNKLSAMVGFRFGKEPETYEYCGYVNDKNKGWKASKKVLIEAGKPQKVRCNFSRNKAWFTSDKLDWITDFDRHRWIQEV